MRDTPPELVRLKLSFVTEEPTVKGHKRNNCAQVAFNFESLSDAEQFAALCIGFLEELLKQYAAKKTGGATRIIVPGAHAV